MLLLASVLTISISAASDATTAALPHGDDGTALGKQRCKQKRAGEKRRACVQAYLEKKRAATSAAASTLPATADPCPSPSDSLTEQQSLRMAQCLHGAEATKDWLREHILQDPQAVPCDLPRLPASGSDARKRCILHAGNANWTADGLVDSRPDCGRRWLRTACVRKLLAGRDALFIGNSVVRRQMYTVIDLLAGPAARRIQGSTELLPPALTLKDQYPLTDPLLMTQHGVLNPKTTQAKLPGGATRWNKELLSKTRMWDRDGDPDAYHAAQLVTIDLDTGEHRFSRPHALCGLGDTHMKFGNNRMMQWRQPGMGPGGRSDRWSVLGRGWQTTKYAGREWRPMVSFRLEPPAGGAEGGGSHAPSVPKSCASANASANARAVPRMGSAPGSLDASPTSAGPAAAALRAEVLAAVEAHFAGLRAGGGGGGGSPASPAVARGDEFASLARYVVQNVSVHVELPPQPTGGPNVWVLFPAYHGERERFNGYCEDKPAGQPGACECTGKAGSCSHKFCRGKRLCAPIGPHGGTAVHVQAARSLASAVARWGALRAGGAMGGVGSATGSSATAQPPRPSSRDSGGGGGTGGQVLRLVPSGVRASVLYDDCWEKRGRCQGHRPCAEPGDQMLTCRATAMLCGGRPWTEVLEQAKRWIPKAHRAASMLYLFDGASSDLFDETFRTWGPQSVGYGSSPVVFGPQFASAPSQQLAHSLGLIAGAVRRADTHTRACATTSGPSPPPTALILRSPAFNIDPVNSFRQQAAFARRVRPIAEAEGVTFLDTYRATKRAVLQKTSHAIRFDHFSAFHFFDSGRYLQAQLLLHVLRLLGF